MTKKTIEKFYSDLSGEEIETANPTVKFTLDSVSYEIDLTESERKSLAAALSPFIGAARTAGRKAASQRIGPPAAEVRFWAIEQGIKIPKKGRIPLEILASYEKTH